MRQVRSSEVKEAALAAGFDLAGVAALDDPALDLARERYEQWLTRGFAASMDYLKRHALQKGSPRELLPGAKSVVCVGLLYGAEQPASDDPARALVSIYTRGPDYHALIDERLATLSAWLAARGVKARAFVDAAPVFERFWAWRAGLGWLGRNSMLIHRKVGSYFFIGGLLVDAALEPDAPDIDHCGRCRKCIDACPTSAITDERSIESGKCIAYHTIENRGSVPEAVMAGTGRWIAGCDICQEVCPWNDPLTPGPAFSAANPAFGAPLSELARWDEPRFKRETKELAMSRMKYSMFLRNVAVAVANSGLAPAEKEAALASLRASASRLPESPGRAAALEALTWAG